MAQKTRNSRTTSTSNTTRNTKNTNTTKKNTKTTNGKKASTRAGGSKSKSRGKAGHPSDGTSLSMVQYEILSMIALVLIILSMVSIYFSGIGIVGAFIRSIFFGLTGVSAYILPIGLFVATIFKIFNRNNERLDVKILLGVLMILLISVFAHIIFIKFSKSPQLFLKLNQESGFLPAFFPTLYTYFKVSGTHYVAGGLIGGLIGDVLLLFMGKVGSIIVIILIFISLIIAFTEQSFFMLVQKLFHLVVSGLKGGVEKLSEREKKEKKVDKEKQNIEMEKSKEKEEKIKKGIGSIPNLIVTTIQKDKEMEYVKHIEENEPKEEKQKLQDTLLDETEEKQVNENISPISEGMADVGVEKNDQDNKTMEQFQPDIPVVEEVAKKAKKTKETMDEVELRELQADVVQETLLDDVSVTPVYRFPPIELLKRPEGGGSDDSEILKLNANKLEETLLSFGVKAKVVDVSKGPAVTRYELQPEQGVKVSKIVNLQDDIALNLAASGIRIEAPIPGKAAVGIEVPNNEVSAVYLREVLDTDKFSKHSSKVSFALGKDISGNTIIADIAKMPHMLIAGATGSGKSVCVNTLISSILYKSSPDEVKLLMIDPKVVELSIYNGIPHLLIPVVTEPKKAAAALNWAVQEMTDRYKLFAAANVRDMKGYNKVVEEKGEMKKLPQIVIIVDELADLMMVAPNDVEDAICRLAQMARAAGLHLIIATQRPSVDVITGLIKANIPSRIAFSVSSGTDSRTIIDMVGAEKLLGKGDMLFSPVGVNKPIRVQGAFVSDKEVENIVEFLKEHKKASYDKAIMNTLDKSAAKKEETAIEFDEYFEDALALCVDKQKASASMIQRKFRVGFARAARILNQLHEAGYVGDEEGSKPREVLLTKEAFRQLKEQANAPEKEIAYETPDIETTVAPSVESITDSDVTEEKKAIVSNENDIN